MSELTESRGESVSDGTWECASFVEVLRRRASNHPDHLAFRFLVDGERDEVSLNYGELDLQAKAIAAELQSRVSPGTRALLLYPPGLEFIAAFFGCLYAGVVAIPAYPPYPAHASRALPLLRAIVKDAQPVSLLSTLRMLSTTTGLFSGQAEFGALQRMATDKISLDRGCEWVLPQLDTTTTAFLQYTSGSTAEPKGVIVNQANLLHNSALIQQAFGGSAESRGVSWLPPYHDMGLIGSILQPLYVGGSMTLMSPAVFLQRPFRWLQAISRAKATHSGGPNFAYDLCVRKVTLEQKTSIDLSSWAVAFNGAEPIREETLDRFARAFEMCGFRREALCPCYGLAETTLMVTSRLAGTGRVTKTVDATSLERHYVVETALGSENGRQLVGSGRTFRQLKVVIANPVTRERCGADEIGEIWITGSSVAVGYWNRPDDSERTFNAYLSDSGEGPFLRTGDLGFLCDEDLFVTGRIKDLLIISGRNIYPQDIELTVERSHPSLRIGCGTAFSTAESGEDRLVVVQELEYREQPDLVEVTRAIRRAVADEHGIQLSEIILVKPGTIPKTSSGKIKRHACKSRFQTASLDGCLTQEPFSSPLSSRVPAYHAHG